MRYPDPNTYALTIAYPRRSEAERRKRELLRSGCHPAEVYPVTGQLDGARLYVVFGCRPKATARKARRER